MRVKDVPQDPTLTAEGLHEVCYAVDEDGKFLMVSSTGWKPKGEALTQAWELIVKEISDVLKKVRAGRLSPLAYHMTRNLMNTGLLAKYAGFSRFRVWWHLRPGPFGRLKKGILERYADVFGITSEQLVHVPETFDEEFYKNKNGYSS